MPVYILDKSGLPSESTLLIVICAVSVVVIAACVYLLFGTGDRK